MQKIERHKTTAVPRALRKSWISLLSGALLVFLVFMPLFDAVPFGERSFSLFIGFDIVAILVFFLAYRLSEKRMKVPLTGVQITALIFHAVAAFVFTQTSPAFDSFFGIHDEPLRAFLPISLFILTILCLPLLRIDKNTIHLFLSASFVLPLVALPVVFFGGSTEEVGFISMYTLLVGMLMLPLYTMTPRTFLAVVVIASVAMFEFFTAFPMYPALIVPLALFFIYYISRMLRALYHERHSQHVSTRLIRSPSLRVQGVIAIVFFIGVAAMFVFDLRKSNVQDYVAEGTRSFVALRDVTFDGDFRVVLADMQYRGNGYPAVGTLIHFAQGAGILGMFAIFALMPAPLYGTFRPLREPEYYEKVWYLFLQANAAIVFFGTVYALFVPIGIGAMLLVATSYGMLSVCILKLTPSYVWMLTTAKYHTLRRIGASALVLAALFAGYYTARYAAATMAAQHSDFMKAYHYAPAPHYLARAIAQDSLQFTVALGERSNESVMLDLARSATTRIAEARKQYPDDIRILLIALSHYELLTQVGVSGAVNESLAVLEKISAQYPSSSAFALRYAAVLLEVKNPKDALAVLEKHAYAFEDASSLEYDRMFAYVLMALEDYAAAADRFEAILAKPENGENIETYLAYAISRIHTNIPAARKILGTALTKFPNEVRVYIYSALAAQIDRDMAAAQIILEEGLRKAPPGEAQHLRTLLDELMQKGSITSIGISGLPAPEPIDFGISTSTASTTDREVASSTDAKINND